MWAAESIAEVEAPPSAVWQAYVNPGTWREWAHSTARAAATAPLDVGSIVTIHPLRGPRQRVRIVTLEPEQRLASELALPGALMTFQYEIERLGATCRVRHRVAMTGPLSALYGLFMRRGNERKLADETRRLAQRLGPGVSPPAPPR